MRCNRCIMDSSSDPTMTFDEQGNCNYCREALINLQNKYFPNEDGEKKLRSMLEKIKESGKGKKYDCIIGISGGLDSSYLAYKVSQWGLRTLAIHIDDGYDTEISKSNIKKLIEKTGFDYEVVAPDAEQFNALTLAYMRAGVPNIAVPQDNILFAFLYKKVKEYKIKYFMSGANWSLESIAQSGNTWRNTDVVNIKDIHKRFGTKPIDKLEFISTLQRQSDEHLLGTHTVTPLDYIDYNRERAFSELFDFCGFEYYGRKHLENALTAFVQLRWFPEKFNVDKRTWHLSSMIVSCQMSRDEALKEIEEPMYNSQQMREYENLIEKNLGITHDELEKLIKAPAHQHNEYKIEDTSLSFRLYNLVRNIRRKIKYGKVDIGRA